MTAPDGTAAIPAQAEPPLNLEWLRERTEEPQWRGAMRQEVAAFIAEVQRGREQVSSLRKMMATETVQDGYLRTYADEIVRLEGDLAVASRVATDRCCCFRYHPNRRKQP